MGKTTALLSQNCEGYSRRDYVCAAWSIRLAHNNLVLWLLFKQNSRGSKTPGNFPTLKRIKIDCRHSLTSPPKGDLCSYGLLQIQLPRWATPCFSTAPHQRFSRLLSVPSHLGPLPFLPSQPVTSLRTGSSYPAFLGLWHGAHLTNICFCLTEGGHHPYFQRISTRPGT